MIPIQMEIEFHANRFDFVHKKENNAGSETNLNANRSRFNRKCQQVFDMLMEGQELTVLGCAIKGISSLPRRILDLREKGIIISDRWENGVKVYYIAQENKTQTT